MQNINVLLRMVLMTDGKRMKKKTRWERKGEKEKVAWLTWWVGGRYGEGESLIVSLHNN